MKTTHLSRRVEIGWREFYMYRHLLIAILLTTVTLSVSFGEIQRPSVVSQPIIQDIQPPIVGVGGKFKITGRNMGNAQNAVVVFNGSVITTSVESHLSNQIIARVPVGAQSGSLTVVAGVDADFLRYAQTTSDLVNSVESESSSYTAQDFRLLINNELNKGKVSNHLQTHVTFAYVDNGRLSSEYVDSSEGLSFIRSRMIVDLRDFHSFETILDIADKLGADLSGYFPITNSYVLDLRNLPSSLKELERVMARVKQDPRVVDVWKDMALNKKQIEVYANVDAVKRYRHNYNDNLHGRIDAYYTDRIQAPGAWNLLDRFIPSRSGRPAGRASLHPMRILVLDTGCNQNHPEFDGVDLKKLTIVQVRLRIAGRDVILPGAIAEAAYDLGDGDGHGTHVVSLIAAKNDQVIGGNAQGDRGINGLLHNPMPYTIYVNRSSDWRQAGEWSSFSEFVSSINAAAIHGVRIMSASWGQPYPINMATSARSDDIKVALRKLAHQLNQFRDRLLLVVAAGNEARPMEDPEGMRGRILPFEDINLNGVLDSGEDLDGNGSLTHGNYVAASLGTLPNVITVGAIDQNDQRADFSNWGISVKMAAPGVRMLMAGGLPATGGTFTIGGARYIRASGTSFATPLVSGTAALLLGIQPALTPQQLKDRIVGSSLEVNTVNGSGGGISWNTLKSGFAVRQLLVDEGIINNDQLGTGVSKLVFTTYLPNRFEYRIGVLEIRRGANGRAEGFQFRRWNSDNPEHSPVLTHDGRWVSYFYKVTGTEVWTYKLPSSNYHVVDTSTSPNNLGFAIGYAPDDTLMYGFRRTQAGGGPRSWELWSFDLNGVYRKIAETGWVNLPLYFSLNSMSWRPDNRAWKLDYLYYNNVNPTFHGFLDKTYNPNSVANIPALTASDQVSYFCYSPDGFGRAWLNTDLVTAYPDSPTSTTYFTRRQKPADFILRAPPQGGLCWSPDGSEIAYSFTKNDFNLAKIVTLRRDHRDLLDRNYLPIFERTGPNSLIGTLSWQW